MNQYDITFIGCDNIFKNVEELRDLIKLGKTKEKIIKSQIEHLNSDNSYGHPNKEVLSTLEYFEIYRTDIDGSIVVKIKNNKFNIETCSPQKGVDMIEEIDKTYYQIENKILNHEIYQNIKDYSKAKEKIKTYLEVGKLLKNVDTKYGKNVIKDYSKRLTNKFGKKYTSSLLYKIKQFYNIIEKVPTLSGKLTWSHWYEMLSFDDINKIEYYVNQCEVYNLDVRQLRNKIKSNEYERIPADARNKLRSRDDIRIMDFVKNPINIRNSNKKEIISEKILQKLILEDIPTFLKELGNGFTFIDNEYKIKLYDRYNYIDLLLYNIKYKCYVVVELKVTELKKEHTGQIMTYMNYIDKNIKTIEENDTVGIIICKQDNEYVIKYCSDDRIIAREYELV